MRIYLYNGKTPSVKVKRVAKVLKQSRRNGKALVLSKLAVWKLNQLEVLK